MEPEDSRDIVVRGDKLQELLQFIYEGALRNHKLHENWNEGGGAWADCSRGDCTEVRELLKEWSYP